MNEVWTALCESRQFNEKETVYVAVSGGADSMMLLHAIKMVEARMSLIVKAIHIHHGLRLASDGEAEFVKRWCDEHQVPLEIHHIEVKAKMTEGYSVEEAARVLRYNIFDQYIRDGVKIALGHHKLDQAETVLMNLFRGTGLKGLGGIRPIRGAYIRPLLSYTKEAILHYLEENNIPYVEDESNLLPDYTRNRIRLEVMPLINEVVGYDVTANIANTASLLQEEEYYLNSIMLEALAEVRSSNESMTIDKNKLLALDVVLIRRVIRHMIGLLPSGLNNVSRAHITSVIDLINGGTGKKMDLPGKNQVTINYNQVTFSHKELALKSHTSDLVIQLDRLVEGEIIRFGPFFLEKRVYLQGDEFPKKTYTKWFDYDKIRGNLVARNRRNGDFIRIDSHGHKKKVKDYLMDIKMPIEERDDLVLLADVEEVIWLTGHRINEGYKITDLTKMILEVTYK